MDRKKKSGLLAGNLFYTLVDKQTARLPRKNAGGEITIYDIEDMPPFAKERVLKIARRQLEAANLAGYQVEWLVSDRKAVQQFTNLFTEYGVRIKVTYYPE